MLHRETEIQESTPNARQLSREFNAPIGSRGRFEPLFKEGDIERGGWVHRPWEVLESQLPEQIEEEIRILRDNKIKTLGFVGMGGESSIIGPTKGTIINLSSTSPKKLERSIEGQNIAAIHWFVISKSGKTTETLHNGEVLEKLYQDNNLDPKDFITYVTDPGTPMATEKLAAGFPIKYRELNGQTSIGGRNSLVNYPTLLSYLWQNPGKLRTMLTELTKTHTTESGYTDSWIKAGIEIAEITKNGRSKVAILQPEAIRKNQWVWEQQTPEEALGKRIDFGFSVYTTPPDLETLRKNGNTDWTFVELRVASHEKETEDYANAASKDGHPVITIPVLESDAFASQITAFGIMKLVAAIGAVHGINFSDQYPVEKYKALMRERSLQLNDAIKNANGNVAKDEQFTLVYDGLLPFLNNDQVNEIKKLQSSNASPRIIYNALLGFTRHILTAQTLAYYDDVDENAERILKHVTQDLLHKEKGYAAKSGEGTGVMHGLYVNWYSGLLDQIPTQIVASEHEGTGLSSRKGAQILIEGAVASHLSLVEAKRPSLMLIVNGKLNHEGQKNLQEFFE